MCGSEDASITLWSRDKGEILAKMPSIHSQVINCVAWSPSDPHLMITCSDDQNIKVWGTESMLPCDISQVGEVKRGHEVKSTYGLPSDNEDDEDDEEDEDYHEEAMEDDDEIYRLGGSNLPILQATRVLESQPSVREEDEDEEMMRSEDEWS